MTLVSNEFVRWKFRRRKQRKFRYKKIRAWDTVLALKKYVHKEEKERGNRGRPNGGWIRFFKRNFKEIL